MPTPNPKFFVGAFAQHGPLTVLIVEIDGGNASIQVISPPSDYTGPVSTVCALSELTLLPPYPVEGIGTVTAHEGDSFVVAALNGSVYGYRSPSGTPSEELAAAEIAYAIAHPPAFPAAPRRQDTRVILDRLTPDESAALTACTHTGIRLLVLKATATGAIRDDDPDFPAAVAGLHALGIIATSRWDALFAP